MAAQARNYSQVTLRCAVCAQRRPSMTAPMLAQADHDGQIMTFHRHGQGPPSPAPPPQSARAAALQRTGALDPPRTGLMPVGGTPRVVQLACRRCSNAPRVKRARLAALAAESAGEDVYV